MERQRIDGINLKYNAPVTLTLALLSLLALALAEFTDGWTTQHLFCVYRSSLSDYLTYPRFVLHVLGSTDLTTCTANVIIMLVVGPAAEDRFGSAKVLVAVLLTAIATGLVMWFLFPDAVLMGMSGEIFMLMVLASFASVRGGYVPLTLLLVLVLYLGSEVLQAISGVAGLQELTHIAGGVVGLLLGMVYSRSSGA